MSSDKGKFDFWAFVVMLTTCIQWSLCITLRLEMRSNFCFSLFICIFLYGLNIDTSELLTTDKRFSLQFDSLYLLIFPFQLYELCPFIVFILLIKHRHFTNIYCDTSSHNCISIQFFSFNSFWLHCMALEILVPRPVEAQSLNTGPPGKSLHFFF